MDVKVSGTVSAVPTPQYLIEIPSSKSVFGRTVKAVYTSCENLLQKLDHYLPATRVALGALNITPLAGPVSSMLRQEHRRSSELKQGLFPPLRHSFPLPIVYLVPGTAQFCLSGYQFSGNFQKRFLVRKATAHMHPDSSGISNDDSTNFNCMAARYSGGKASFSSRELVPIPMM